MPVAPSRVTLRSGMAPPGLRLAMAQACSYRFGQQPLQFTVVYSMQVVAFPHQERALLVKYIAKLNTGTNKWNKSVRRINNFVRGLYGDSTDL